MAGYLQVKPKGAGPVGAAASTDNSVTAQK
jgi:hypothetical protein